MSTMQSDIHSLGAKGRKSNLTRVLLEGKHYWPMLIVILVCVILINIADIAQPFILQVIIDDFMLGKKAESGIYSVAGMGWLYLAAIVVGSALTYAQVNLVNYIGQNVIQKLRRRVFSYIQMMPLKHLDKISAGRLITRATNDVEALTELFTDILVNLFRDVVLLVGIVITMFQLNVQLALVSCIGLPFIAVVSLYTRTKLRKNFTVIKALIGQINGFFAENISGMKIVQMFMKQKDKLGQFLRLNDEYFKSSMTQIKVNSLLRPVMEVINALVISTLIWFALKPIAGGVLELGVLYAFTNYVKKFFDPINELAEMYTNIQSASVSANRIYELLDNTDEQEDLDEGEPLESFSGRIEFKNVWFAYIDKDWVLKNVSFTIEPGQRVAFVGTTGSGKTTIISLLTRFYDIQQGQILVDGRDVRTIRLSDLRRQIAVVLQDVFLFAGSIYDNVRLEDAIPDQQIMNALELSQAATFIKELPNGLDTPVMERGASFSSGQRQLISFARAIVHDPAVFVLDEATAYIDTATEQMIQTSLNNMANDRTMIIIAHRLSTIRNCDCIFVMHRGVIAEQGTHDQLLAIGGRYFRLHKAQSDQMARVQ